MSQYYLCKAASSQWEKTSVTGSNGAIETSLISAGSICPAGGTSIKFGLDTDNNGKLEEAEVTSTAYICNGTAGATAAAGPTGPTGEAGEAGPTGCRGYQQS